jgi:hypothetical protein
MVNIGNKNTQYAINIYTIRIKYTYKMQNMYTIYVQYTKYIYKMHTICILYSTIYTIESNLRHDNRST